MPADEMVPYEIFHVKKNVLHLSRSKYVSDLFFFKEAANSLDKIFV